MSLQPYKIVAIARTDAGGSNIIPLAEVAIINGSGGYQALFESDLTTPIANPATADNNGELEVWIEPGYYTVTVSGGQSWPIVVGMSVDRKASYADISAIGATYPFDTIVISDDGRSGILEYDPADTTSPAVAGMVFVDAAARRWKRRFNGVVYAKWFGAVGDGIADDYLALQAALDFIAAYRGVDLCIEAGKYNISQGLVFKPASVPAALSGSDIHFSEHVESKIYGSGDARIIATAAITDMLLLQFNSATSSIGPFYSTVEGLTFDGANLASTAISSDFVMHLNILDNKIWRVTNGIDYLGYGVADIRGNVIKASYCINFEGGGGDSSITQNDFYPLANGRGVNIAKLGSNAAIQRNVFNGEGFTNVYGVYLDGTANTASDLIINVRVSNNEFSGMKAGVYAEKHSGGRNIHGIKICDNHTIASAGGAVNTGSICRLIGVDDAEIYDNQVNGVSLAATITSDDGISLDDCRRAKIRNNKLGNLLGTGIYLNAVVDSVVSGNELIDTARAGAGGVVIDVDTGTTGTIISDNIVRQSSGSYGQSSILERAGANGNYIYRTIFTGCNRPSIVGTTTILSGNVLATGNISLSGGTLVILSNSSGFTAVRTGVGVVTVTLATTYGTSNYRVKCVSDASCTVDTQTTSSFRVRTFNIGTSTAVDAALIQIEVTG